MNQGYTIGADGVARRYQSGMNIVGPTTTLYSLTESYAAQFVDFSTGDGDDTFGTHYWHIQGSSFDWPAAGSFNAETSVSIISSVVRQPDFGLRRELWAWNQEDPSAPTKPYFIANTPGIVGYRIPSGATTQIIKNPDGSFKGIWVYPSESTPPPPQPQQTVISTRRETTVINATTGLTITALGGGDDAVAGLNLDGGTGNDLLGLNSDSRFELGLNGKNLPVFLYGNDGNDVLDVAGESASGNIDGEAIFIGGRGRDILNGAEGRNVFMLLEEDSIDTITDSGSSVDDEVVFGPGVTAGSLRVLRADSDPATLFLLTADGTGARVQVNLSGDINDRGIEHVSFNDGTRLTVAQLLARLDDSQIVQGSTWNDTLILGAGNDVIDGGQGNDTLAGGAGNDVYRFGRGSGQDVIDQTGANASDVDVLRFAADVLPADVTVFRDDHNLYFEIADSGDLVVIKGWFDGGMLPLSAIEFADGTVWAGTQFDLTVPYKFVGDANTGEVFGTESGDELRGLGNYVNLHGEGGDDTLYAGAGARVLTGGIGNDTYVFGRGDGAQWIFRNSDGFSGDDLRTATALVDQAGAASGDTDVIRVKHGVVPSDVALGRYGTDLVLTITDTDDRLVLKDWFDLTSTRVKNIQFANGTVWDETLLEAMVPLPVLTGTDAGDTLLGAEGIDAIQGLGGDDSIYGMAGPDRIDGGAGDDWIDGGEGNDTYLFGRGDGHDTIDQSEALFCDSDVIRFKAGVAPADVALERSADGLRLTIRNTGDSIQVGGAGIGMPVSRVQFADGTVWDSAVLDAAPLAIIGTDSDDNLGGTAGKDILRGLGGDDTLMGYEGDDILIGGTGNDALFGGPGNDVYYFGRGDGHDMLLQNDSAAGDLDVVRFADGITPEAVAVSVANGGSDIVLTIADTGDSLTLQNWFSPSGARVSAVEFADGTVWDAATLAGLTSNVLIGTEAADTLLGTSGNDTLFGRGGDDTLVGASGDDRLYGEDGNDTLKGGTGDDSLDGGAGDDVLRGGAGNDRYYVDGASGHDTIVETPGSFGTNSLTFGPDVSPDSLGFTRYAGDGNDLLIALGGGDATVKLNNWFNGANSARVAAFEFDGQSWDANAIDAAIWANNSAPVVDGNWSRQILIDQAFNLNLKQGMFADPDGDRLAYSATSADGSPLPAWLAFDATTGKFSGMPAATDVGLLSILVTAQDEGSLSASSVLSLNVRTNTPASVAIVDQVVGLGTSFDVAPLLAVTDADGDVPTMYQFRDTPEGGGYLMLEGTAQPALTTITVTPDQIADLRYVGGAMQGDGKLKVRAYDGFAWGAWSNWDVVSSDHATNVAPDVTASAGRVSLNAVAAASTLFGVSDADGDAIQKYQLIDTAEGGGYFTLDGVTQTAGTHIEVSAAQLASLDYVGGNVQSTEKLKARAWDGLAWGAWTAWDMASSNHAINAAPVATAANRSILAGQALAAGSLFSITDGDGDAPVQYQFWDAVNGGGYFRVNGTAQAAGAAITVLASDLASVSYVGGAGNAATEAVKVRASDGLAWGAWKSWKMTTTGYQQGGSGNDTLTGTGGDILSGGAGNDTLSTPSGNGLLAGGAGNDALTGGNGADFYVGNSGNDTIHTGSGAAVVAFNAGDGQDAVYFGGTQPKTLSLGGGIGYQNLALSKNGNDLVLETGDNESIMLKDWYAGSANHGQTNLQLIAEAMAGFDAHSADPLYNARVQTFDLDALAADFDAARAGNATLTRWSVMDRLLESHLAGSDNGALGGDLAYQYGVYGNLGNVGTTGARNVLEGSQYGVGIQSFQSFSGLQEGVARLG